MSAEAICILNWASLGLDRSMASDLTEMCQNAMLARRHSASSGWSTLLYTELATSGGVVLRLDCGGPPSHAGLCRPAPIRAGDRARVLVFCALQPFPLRALLDGTVFISHEEAQDEFRGQVLATIVAGTLV